MTSHVDFGERAIPTIEVLGNGVIECAADDANCARDRQGHGTHCAATVGGTQYGVAKSATLHAVKVLSDSGRGSFSWFVEALDWVATYGERPAVFSASLGGQGNIGFVETAIDQATAAGVVVVVAAGNDDMDACEFSPAHVSSAITVGATSSDDTRAYYSNHGSCLDIFAPGSSITSAAVSSDSDSATMSGTSMACPHVAGAAALPLQHEPNLTPSQVAERLQEVATPDMVKDPVSGSPNRLLYTGDFSGSPSSSSTSPSPAPPSAGDMWKVTEGPCVKDAAGCIQSPNYPSQYGNNEQCTIVVTESIAVPIVVEKFKTEKRYDKLTVDGVVYDGTDGPHGVTPKEVITWYSDTSVTDDGWKLCPSQTIPSTSTTPSITSTTTTTTSTSTTTTTPTTTSTSSTTSAST